LPVNTEGHWNVLPGIESTRVDAKPGRRGKGLEIIIKTAIALGGRASISNDMGNKAVLTFDLPIVPLNIPL
jgi:hypothetical protein